MKQKVGIIGLTAFFVVIMVSLFAQAQSVNPQETLNQYIADLQKNPNDNALREKIIKHVRTMKPAPEISEEARRHMNRGIAAMKDAKSADDFRDVVKEFEKASLATPWFANAYYNLGIAQDKAGIYADAIKSLELYLLAASDTRDAESVKGLIYEIEYRQEKAQKEVAAKKYEEAKPDFSGVWGDANSELCWRYTFFISEREITMVEDFMGGLTEVWKGNLDGRNFEGSFPGDEVEGTPAQRFKGSLSTDNKTIKLSTIVDPEVATTEAKKKHAQANIQGFIQRFGQRPGWDTSTLIRKSPCK